MLEGKALLEKARSLSNRPEDLVLDGYLWLGLDRQLITRDRATFDGLRAAAGRETVDGD